MQSNAILDAISVLISCIYNLEINLRDIAENFNFDRNLSDWGKNQQLLQILVPKGMLEIATGFALAMTKRN